MVYAYKNGYSLKYNKDTIEQIENRKRCVKRGLPYTERVKYRYDVVQNDGLMTIVQENLTRGQVGKIASEIIQQGSFIV